MVAHERRSIISDRTEQAMRNVITIEYYSCAKCGTAVETKWTARGMLSDPNCVLVAAWVFHSSCWDGMVRENPPSESHER